MPLIYPTRLRGWRFILLNVAIGLANVAVLSNVPGYAILAPYVASNLQGVTPSFGAWGTTDYAIGLALGFPIARWLVARFGDYRVYATALILYALLSFACVAAESIYSFVAVRVLLGLAGGVILPVGQALLLGEYPPQKRAFGVGFWGFLSMAPFTVGMFMGGFCAEHLGWRSLFYSNAVIALIVAAISSSLVYGRGFQLRIARFDSIGFILLTIILLGTQTIFNQGNDFDWFESPFLFIVLIAVAMALPCFVVWELSHRHPVVELRLFSHRNFAIATICSVAGFLAISALVPLLVVQLQLLLGYSSTLAGLVYLTMIFSAAPLVAVIHVLVKGGDARFIACANFLGFAATFTWLGLFDKPASFDQLLWPMVFYGFSLAFFFTPLATLAVHGLPAAKLMRAAEELTLLRTAAGAFGIALGGVVLFRRTPFHQLDLADHFGGRRFASFDVLSEFSNRLQASGLSGKMALSQMGRLIRQESTLLAMNDAFLLAAAIFVALAAFVWLANPTIARPVEKLRAAEAEEMMEQG